MQFQTVDEEQEEETLTPDKQHLRVMLDKRNRKGKEVTLITDFIGTDDDLKDLARTLKTKCGVGGSARGGEILLQGDFRTKVRDLLVTLGYVKTKLI